MSENLGDAVLRLSVDDTQLDRQLDAAGKKASSSVSRAGKGIMKAGAGLTAGLTLPLMAFAKVAAGEMGDIETANNQTAAAIARIGAHSKVSVAGVQELAGALQQKSGIDDQAIQSASNYILTLGAIDTATASGAKTFQAATTTAVNMAEALGMDVGAAGKQVAKSMAAASQGALLLPRGMKLSADETKRTEDAMKGASSAAERQAIVMGVLGKKFEGAANLTNADRWAVVQDQFAGIGATLLTTLMPTFQKFTNWLTQMMGKFNALSPGMQSFIAKAMLIGGILGPVIVMVGAVVTAIGAIGLPVAAAVAAIVALGAILLKSGLDMDKLKARALALGQGVRTFVQVLTGQSTQARSTMTGLQQAFARAADAIRAAFKRIVSFVTPVLSEIRQTLSVWGGWASAFWAKFGDEITSVVGAAFGGLVSVVGPLLNALRSIVTAVLRLLRGDFSGAWSAIKSAASSFFSALVALVRGLGSAFLGAAKGIGSAIINGIMGGLKAGKDKIINYLKSLGEQALTAAKKKLHIASPSRAFYNEVGLPISQGIAMGIQAGTSGVIEQLNRQIDGASEATAKRLKKRLKPLEAQARRAAASLNNILGNASMSQSVADLWASKRPENIANMEKENAIRTDAAKEEYKKLQRHLKKNGKRMSQSERQAVIDRMAQINNDISGWAQELADAKQAKADADADALAKQADANKEEADRIAEANKAAENLRREALGLPSLEEEAHTAAVNAIRQQYGLPPLAADGSVAGTATSPPATSTPTTATGGATTAQPVIINQTFSGEPDMFAASHKASFAYRTVGLGVA